MPGLLKKIAAMWTLDCGREEVARVQLRVREFGYHVALGGGVLNAGESNKDLDLYFLPLDNVPESADPVALVEFLESLWGVSEDLQDPRYARSTQYTEKLKFNMPRRIDVFIL